MKERSEVRLKKKTIDRNVMKSLQRTEFHHKEQTQNFKKKMDITAYNRNLLVSVGRGRGGLYIVNPFYNRIQRKHKGIFAGVIKYRNGFMALKQPNELCIFDEKLNIKQVIHVQDDSDSGLHDLKLSEDGFLYIVASPQNKIIVYEEKTLTKQAEIILSTNKKDVHHINDLYVTGDKLFLSMFSSSGEWEGKQPDHWDGAIVAFDRYTFEPQGIIIDKLTAPHSITMNNGSLCYCNSLNLNVSKFDLKLKKKEVIAQFKGFTRGLYFDKNILIAGQSKMRHLQRLNHKFPNISDDGGIHLFDCESRVSKFIKLPVGNPYSIIAIQ